MCSRSRTTRSAASRGWSSAATFRTSVRRSCSRATWSLMIPGQGKTSCSASGIPSRSTDRQSAFTVPRSRWRIEASPNFGAWQFTQGLVDWRRYFFARPFTLALRGLVLGRSGRDADLFQQFLGSTELIRGYTAGSVINHECISRAAQNSCPELDQLIGSSLAVVNAELRFPLTRSLVLGFLPVGLPPIEGAIFYDAGLAWNSNSKVLWSRTAAQDAQAGLYRAPLRSWGGSIRVNALGFVVLRLDYTKPLSRSYKTPYWTLSLGPTF